MNASTKRMTREGAGAVGIAAPGGRRGNGPADAAERAEILRQAAVFASGVLAIRQDDTLLAIVARASALLDTPMAAMSIVDRDRQWFPVAFGLPRETPRALSFCAYTVLTPEQVFCVPDAQADPRFATNALVTAPPSIRFYAGAPLVDADGQALGALCAMGRQPRATLSAGEQRALADLAADAMAAVERLRDRRSHGTEALEHIVEQMRRAARDGDEPLLLALNRLVQSLERTMALPLPLPPHWPGGR